jgi:membrane-bound acyltransferase YfiQ involved in biofilm formation
MATSNINLNNPSVIIFISEITHTIVTNVQVDKYFKLTQDKKMSVLYIVYKLIKTTSEARVKLTDVQFNSFLNAMLVKNEDSENYEVAAILSDIIKNYDSITEFTKPAPKRKRKETVKKPKTNEDS